MRPQDVSLYVIILRIPKLYPITIGVRDSHSERRVPTLAMIKTHKTNIFFKIFFCLA